MFREFLVNLRISKLVARIDSRSQEITIVSLVPALYRGSLAASQKSASFVFSVCKIYPQLFLVMASLLRGVEISTTRSLPSGTMTSDHSCGLAICFFYKDAGSALGRSKVVDVTTQDDFADHPHHSDHFGTMRTPCYLPTW